MLGGIPIDAVTFDGAVQRIDELVSSGLGGAVFTPNVDHVVLAQRNSAFRSAYAAVELALADGMPIVWSSRLLGTPVPGKVSGSDLLFPLAQHAVARGWRVYLIGGQPGVAAEAASSLSRLFPGIVIAGTDAPFVNAEGPDPASEAALERLCAARPDIVLVAFGAPKQEIWIHRHRDRLRPAVAIGIGAGLDFLAGRVRRAPRWISRVGLEWAWRLAQEPRRLWRRYLVEDPRFAAILWRELRRARPGTPSGR
jgi:N-acetylglucosaminyldiphosphoundecaprenol N-acetyl-beta-D-mannosaminyltransferase